MTPAPGRKPSPFIIEIDGTPVVAFIANTTWEARELAREAWFCAELRERKSGGKLLWDGQAALALRPAMTEEIDAIISGIASQPALDGDIILFYLVPIDTESEHKTVERREFPPNRR